MGILELFLSFFFGIFLLAFLCFLLRIKFKSFFYLAASSIGGLIILIILNAIKKVSLTSLTVFIAGFLGVPGTIVSFIVSLFL